MWTKETSLKIRESRHKEVLDDVIKKESSGNIDINNKLSNYIIENLDIIDYAIYQKKGYKIFAVESSKKTNVKGRLFGTGMRWYLIHAQNATCLKAKLESNNWYRDVVVPTKEYYNIKI